jgi:hypothetical protein
MQRKRSLNPTIWEDPSVNRMSRDGRLAFVGCISNADDDGYLRGDYGSLKRLIFGFDENDDKKWYEELKNFKGLHFYEVNGEIYTHLVNWEKHQSQKRDRRLASLCPKCPLCRTGGGQVADSCPPSGDKDENKAKSGSGGQLADKWRTSGRQREEKEREEKLSEEKGMSPKLSDIPKIPLSFSELKKRNAGRKPIFCGLAVRESEGKLWCIPKGGGKWLSFEGKISAIEWI